MYIRGQASDAQAASKMTSTVSYGALNSTHSLTHFWCPPASCHQDMLVLVEEGWWCSEARKVTGGLGFQRVKLYSLHMKSECVYGTVFHFHTLSLIFIIIISFLRLASKWHWKWPFMCHQNDCLTMVVAD